MQPNTSPPDLSLVDVQLAFAHWRKTRSGREATPHRLKQMAVRLLATESRASVCKALAINTSAFKQWTGAESAGSAATPRNNMVRLTLAARRLVLVMAKNSVYASYTLDAAGKPITDSIVHWVEFKCHADIALHCRFRKCIGVGISQVDWRRIGLVQHCESGFAIKYGRYGVDEAVCI